MKIYYAHCVQLYGTHQEKRDITLLQQLGFEVVNPNEPLHQAGYAQEGMAYFTNRILPGCDGCAFRSLADGTLPAGVAHELDEVVKAGKPVIELPSLSMRRRLTVFETRAFLQETGIR